MSEFNSSRILKSGTEWILDVISKCWYNKFLILTLVGILILSIEIHLHLGVVLYWLHKLVVPLVAVIDGFILAFNTLLPIVDSLVDAVKTFLGWFGVKGLTELKFRFANFVTQGEVTDYLNRMHECIDSPYHSTKNVLGTTLKDTTGAYLCSVCRYIYPTEIGQTFKVTRSFLWDGSCAPMTSSSGPDQNCPHMDTEDALLCAVVNIYAFIIVIYVGVFLLLFVIFDKNFWGFVLSVIEIIKGVIVRFLSRRR